MGAWRASYGESLLPLPGSSLVLLFTSRSLSSLLPLYSPLFLPVLPRSFDCPALCFPLTGESEPLFPFPSGETPELLLLPFILFFLSLLLGAPFHLGFLVLLSGELSLLELLPLLLLPLEEDEEESLLDEEDEEDEED